MVTFDIYLVVYYRNNKKEIPISTDAFPNKKWDKRKAYSKVHLVPKYVL